MFGIGCKMVLLDFWFSSSFGLKFDNKSSALKKRNRIDRLVTAFKLDTPGSRPRNETKKEREGRQNKGMRRKGLLNGSPGRAETTIKDADGEYLRGLVGWLFHSFRLVGLEFICLLRRKTKDGR